jgi:hypothetical protein
MATASLLDKQFIAQDTFFVNMVKASAFNYCTTTVQTSQSGGNAAQKNYAAQVLNDPNSFISDFAWAAAVNQALADAVITTGNGGSHFTTATTAAAVTTAIQAAGIDSTLINNAVAAAFNAMANA